MKKIKASRKLELKSESIKVLTVDDLGRAQGGHEMESVTCQSSICNYNSWPNFGPMAGVPAPLQNK